MQTNEFLNALNSGALPACLLFTGEEEYLKEMSLKALREALLPPGLEEMNETRLDAAADEQTILDAAQQLPFMAEKRLVLISDSLFAFPAPRGGEGASDRLLKLIASPPEGLCLLFTGHGKADLRKKIPAAIKKTEGVVQFDPLSPQDAAKWVKREAARMGKAMDDQIADRFVFMTGASLLDSKAELEKLAAYVGERQTITGQDLEAIVNPSLEANVFQMVDALLDGQSALAQKRLKNLLSDGQSPLAILPLLGRNIRQMCQAKLLTLEGKSRQQVEKEMGLQGFIVRRVLDRSARYDPAWLKSALLMLDESDYAVKSGKISDAEALQLVFLFLSKGAEL